MNLSLNNLDLDDDNTIEFLQNHFFHTNRELVTQTNQNALLQNENAKLKSEARKYQARIDELESKLKSTENRHKSLQNQLDDTRTNLDFMKKELEKTSLVENYEKTQQADKLKILTNERDKYHDRCRNLELELLELKKRFEDEKHHNNDLRASISESKNELATLQQDNNEQLLEFHTQLETYREQNAYLQEKLAKYKRKTKKLIARQRHLEDEDIKLQDQLQNELKEALDSLNITNSRLKQLTEKHNQLNVSQIKLAQEMKEKENQLSLMQQEASSLKSLVDQLQSYQKESDKTKEMLNKELALKDQQLKKRNDFIRKFITNVPSLGNSQPSTPNVTSPKSSLRFRNGINTSFG